MLGRKLLSVPLGSTSPQWCDLLISLASSDQQRCFLNICFGKTVGSLYSYSEAFIVSKVFSNLLCLGCLGDLKVDDRVGHHQQARGVNITHAKCSINAKEAVYLVKFHQGQVTQQLQICP